jgi:hypothetical protein
MLGGFRGHVPSAEDRAKSRTVKWAAQTRAAGLLSLVEELRAAGATTYRALVDELNRRGVPTARGKTWFPNSVRQVLRAAICP